MPDGIHNNTNVDAVLKLHMYHFTYYGNIIDDAKGYT